MGIHVMRKLSNKLQKFTIMIDETTDVTNQEQVIIVMRRIDDVYEEFLGSIVFPPLMLKLSFPLLKTSCYS